MEINPMKKIGTQNAVIDEEIYEFFSCVRIKRKH